MVLRVWGLGLRGQVPVSCRFDSVVIDAKHIRREQRRLKVAVRNIVDTRNINVSLRGAKDVFFAVRKLGDVVRVV